MAYAIHSLAGAQPIANFEATAMHPLGTIVRATDPTYGEGEFIYLKGAANTVVGSVVTYSQDDNSTTLLAANAIDPVAFAMSANVANQYGWYQIFGKAVAKGLSGLVDNANCYATATAGSLDDAVVAGDRIKCCKTASALDTPSTGLVEIECQYPYMDDGLAA